MEKQCEGLVKTQKCEFRAFLQVDSPLKMGTHLKDKKITLNFDWIPVPPYPENEKDFLAVDVSEIKSKYVLEDLNKNKPLSVSQLGSADQLLSALETNTIQIPIEDGQAVGLNSGMVINLYPIYESGETADFMNKKIKKHCKISKMKRKLLAVLEISKGENSEEEISEEKKPKMLVVEADKTLICCLTNVDQVKLLPVLLAKN